MKLSETELNTISRARRYVEGNKRIRKLFIAYGIGALGACGYFAYRLMGKVENLTGATEGFFFGFGLSILASTFGAVGVLFILRSGMRTDTDISTRELLLKLYSEVNKNKD
jgi:hypothetical protein